MTPTSEEVADVLDRAHDELLVRGWCQGSFQRDEKVCAVQAVIVATRGETSNYEKRSVLVDAVCDAFAAENGARPMSFNDDPGRTIDDVLDAFRRTAKQLREEAGAA
jgi:hypothetical protein